MGHVIHVMTRDCSHVTDVCVFSRVDDNACGVRSKNWDNVHVVVPGPIQWLEVAEIWSAEHVTDESPERVIDYVAHYIDYYYPNLA